MTWTSEAVEKLNELVTAKFGEIRGAIRLLPGDFREHAMGIDKALHNYCMGVGLKMNIIHHTETREDLPAPGEAIFLSDGTVRMRNLWGDKYLDIPEDFAVRALALGFLP
jgi:hypothetical protein